MFYLKKSHKREPVKSRVWLYSFRLPAKVSEFSAKGSHFPILCPAELKRTCRWASISSEHLKTGRFLSGHQWEFYIVKHRRQKAELAVGWALPEGYCNCLAFTNNGCCCGWSHLIWFYSPIMHYNDSPRCVGFERRPPTLFLLEGQVFPSQHKCRSQGLPSAALSRPASCSAARPPGYSLVNQERLLTF